MTQANIDTQLAWVISVVQGLPDDLRHVITLRHVYGFNQLQIAAYLHISAEEVHVHLVRAAQCIADAMDDVALQANSNSCPTPGSRAQAEPAC
ncbi:MAG TPA: sigma factor-like helix-turn-helix DNA-binding protein [Steroidobacteraceae bacterium]|nr:sigma factor-like helix-turn-helix DNA-binding protein [Steroidobacteraceae bacterium]